MIQKQSALTEEIQIAGWTTIYRGRSEWKQIEDRSQYPSGSRATLTLDLGIPVLE